MAKIKFNKEQLEEAIKNSINLYQVINNLGKSVGGTYPVLKKYILLWDIDCSHFETQTEKMRRIKCSNKKYTLEEILINGFKGSLSTHTIKHKLYNSKLKQPICELCGQDENWRGKKISLILDHINGNNKDNRIENLRIVCPNCDATLDTYKGKNKKTVS